MPVQTKILLIGIDGLILNRALDSGRAPILKKLWEASYFCDMTVDLPTVSGPSWTTLLTGTTQEIHHVIDNDFTNHKLDQAPDLLTQASLLHPDVTTYAAAGWPPLIDPNDLGPVIRTRPEEQNQGKHFIFVRDGETHGYERIDKEVSEHATSTINTSAPDLNFIYFCGADEAGHLYGTLNGPYFDAIARIDSYVGNLYEAISGRTKSFGEKWLIVITTDHGHRDEGGHGGDSQQERASFVIAHGIGRPHPSWPSQIKPETLVGQILTTL